MGISRREFVILTSSSIALAACGGSTKPKARTFPGSAETFDAGGARCQLLVPPTSNGHLVMYHHGSGEDETAPSTDALKGNLIAAILAAGFAVASSDAAGENWGNDAGLAAYVALDAVLADRFAGKVIHFGQSMGGLTSLRMFSTQARADGWLGVYPVCNLAAMVAAGRFADRVADAGSTVNPTDSDPAIFAGVPMRFYASPEDTLVSKAENTDVMAALVAPVAAEADVVECIGDHGDPSHFRPAEVVDFLARCVA